MVNFDDIDKILQEGPAKKARFFELYSLAELDEDKTRGQVYLEMRSAKSDATVKEIEALVDIDPRVVAKIADRILKEKDFYQAKDELESYYEIARNRRATMKYLDEGV